MIFLDSYFFMDFVGIVSRFSDSSKISSILLYIIPLFSDITYYLFSYCCCPQILSLFILLLSSDIPTDMLRFLLGSHCLFAHALCNSPYGLRQAHAFAAVFPHDGSLATVCGNIRGSCMVQKVLKYLMVQIISKFQKNSQVHIANVFIKVVLVQAHDCPR